MKLLVRGLIISAAVLSITGCASGEAKKKIDAGNAAIKEEKYEEAITDFKEAVKIGKELKNAYRGLGIAQLESGDYASAIKSFQDALSQSKGEVGDTEIDTSYYLAKAQYLNNDFEGAIETYTNLVKYDGKNADSYFLRGKCYVSNLDVENGKKDFDAALKIKSDSAELYYGIYENLIQFDYKDEAKSYLQTAISTIGKTSKDTITIGRIYLALEDYTNATTCFEKAIKAKEVSGYLYLGQACMAQGDTEGAKSNFDSYIKASNPSAEVYNTIGLSYLEAKSYDEALAAFQSGLKCESDTSRRSLLYNEIVTYEYKLDFDTAKTKMEEYIKLYPEDEAAQREYKFLETR